ncbi:hypothetical protein ACWD0J_37170 [Streptomyces sp. NPDC003011]
MTVTRGVVPRIGAVLCAALMGAGCMSTPRSGPPGEGPSPRPGATAASASASARPIPRLGPSTRARLPAATRQALVVSGPTPDSNRSTAVLYERSAGRGWRTAAGPWPAHNALRGWTADHWAGDLRSPVGVFGLGDAGGRLPDPGTRLPYDQDPEFAVSGTGFHGEPLEGSFDYVVAIDYNRVPGTTPLDKTRPLGADKGGGVWIHVDHGGPTQACVSLTRHHLRALLRALDPGKRPVVVMGPAGALGK